MARLDVFYALMKKKHSKKNGLGKFKLSDGCLTCELSIDVYYHKGANVLLNAEITLSFALSCTNDE